MKFKWVSALRLVLSVSLVSMVGCTPASGALGATGYEQSVVKYQLGYSDPAAKKFLPDDWRLDNYASDPTTGEWTEKTGHEYRATRWLDEDGDGTISLDERKQENIFDLRFVNARDSAVIWLKVHPVAFGDSKKDLDVVLENYADGVAGAGSFEQSSLFGLKTDTARQYTTFIVSKKATSLGALAAISGVVELADVEKLRLDPQHRDSKAELCFAHVKYLGRWHPKPIKNSVWPVITQETKRGHDYAEVRTGLLVIGYDNDARRFDSHLADFHALLARLVVPASAVPDFNEPPTIQVATGPSTTAAPESPSAVPSTTPAPISAASEAPAASTAPVAPPAAVAAPPAAKPEAAAPATKAK